MTSSNTYQSYVSMYNNRNARINHTIDSQLLKEHERKHLEDLSINWNELNNDYTLKEIENGVVQAYRVYRIIKKRPSIEDILKFIISKDKNYRKYLYS